MQSSCEYIIELGKKHQERKASEAIAETANNRERNEKQLIYDSQITDIA